MREVINSLAIESLSGSCEHSGRTRNRRDPRLECDRRSQLPEREGQPPGYNIVTDSRTVYQVGSILSCLCA